MPAISLRGFPFGPMDGTVPATDQAARNLNGIILMRTLTIIGQTVAVAVASLHYGWDMPLEGIGLVIGLLVAWNVLTLARSRTHGPAGEMEFFVQLLVDVLQLTALLYLTGGAANPFTWFLLLPLTITATILGAGATWLMVAVTVACYSLLMGVQPALPEGGAHGAHGAHDFGLHVFGMWIGFMVSAALIAVFVAGMARNLRSRERQLHRAREQTLRDEKVVALGALAAGTAHELGTPLATILTVVGEVQRDYPAARYPELAGDMALVREQVERSRQALGAITSAAGAVRPGDGRAMPIAAWLEAMVAEWRCQRPHTRIDVSVEGGEGHGRILTDRTLTQAVHNIMNNAADASPARIGLAARWDGESLCLAIEDDGDGFPAAGAGGAVECPPSTKDHGLGLGLFLSHAVIGRFGGRTTLHNRPRGGALVNIVLPLGAMACSP